MVPAEFADFFVACAGVAGALIGLLFVAISVAPQWSDAEHRTQLDVRAGVAFSALTDALVLSLFAIIPGVNLGLVAVVAGGAATGSCLALGLVVLRAPDLEHRGRQLRLMAAQGVVFVLQIVAGARLLADPHDASNVRELATITVVLFLIGIGRAWQLLGARDTGLLTVVRQAIAERNAPPATREPPTEG